MSLEAKIVFSACVLAIIIPLAVSVLRRLIRGERFDKPKMGDMPMPRPSGPSIDGGS